MKIGIVDSEEVCQRIQHNINHLESQAEKWHMEFISDKSDHFERSNIRQKFIVNDRTLKTIYIQRDFGVHV